MESNLPATRDDTSDPRGQASEPLALIIATWTFLAATTLAATT
jgi:hypothetical protein